MNAVGMCALLEVVMMASGEPATPGNRAMTLTLRVAESDAAPDLEAFLRERARETWHAVESEPSRFEIAVEWPRPTRLVVNVHEAGRELARRKIDVADPGATKLTVWLVVKSTINRALLEGAPVEPATAPAVTGAAPEPPTVRAAEPEPRRPTWGLGVLAGATLSESVSFGPTVLAWLNPWDRLVITLEAGYRVSPTLGDGLTVHYVPMTASTGWQLNPARTWTAGAFASADLKIPVSENGSGMAVGLDLGGYVQTRRPLTEHSRWFARVRVGTRAARTRFLLDEGHITEGPVLGAIAVGALWQ